MDCRLSFFLRLVLSRDSSVFRSDGDAAGNRKNRGVEVLVSRFLVFYSRFGAVIVECRLSGDSSVLRGDGAAGNRKS